MQARPPVAAGPPDVVRVALTDFRWPLDPALARGRDETTLARALYSTPLRTDPVTGTVVPGLCTAWKASPDFRRWTFTCSGSAPSIAAALRRVARLRDAPANWLFAQTERISADATTLNIRLRSSWRRFPYALTAVGAAPRFVPGPFKLVSGTKRLVVARREGLTLQFRRLGARAAVRQFRAGKLDEAPVPLGDIVATKADAQLGSAVRARTLLGLDLVEFDPIGYRLRSRLPRHRGPRRLRAAGLGAQRLERLRLPRRREGGPGAVSPGARRDPDAAAPRGPGLRPTRTGAACRRATSLCAVARRRPGSPARRPRSRPHANVRARARRLSAGGGDSGGARPAQRVGAARRVAARTGRDTATPRPRAWSTNGSGLRREPSRSRGSSTLASSLRDWRVGARTCSGDVDYSAVRSRASSRRP